MNEKKLAKMSREELEFFGKMLKAELDSRNDIIVKSKVIEVNDRLTELRLVLSQLEILCDKYEVKIPSENILCPMSCDELGYDESSRELFLYE